MSLAVDLQSRPTSGSGNFADEHAVTQGVKWMAIIPRDQPRAAQF